MGSTAKKDKRNADILDEDDEVDIDKKASKKAKQGEVKGLLSSIIADEIKGSSRPPSPASFSLEGRKPAEIFRTDLISAMKLPDHQNISPENYITISDQWRQEWERGVQVPVNPDGVFQPSFRPVEPLYKRAGNFKLQNKLLVTPSKTRGRPPGSKCPYDLGRMDVEWITSLNTSRQNKGLMELEESVLEKALAYIENKCYDNMGHAISTQEGLSIEYDEDVCCEVCQSPDSEEMNEMVFCDSCDICVHQACYGIQNIPAGSWLCHPCRKGIKNCHCVLCPLSGGATKKTKNSKGWVHVSCALWIPEVGFGNVSKMEPVTRIENIPASRWNLVCSLCREKVGACIQCTVKSCVTAFHVTCGFKHGLEMRTVLDDDATDGVRHIHYCTKHSHKSKSPSKRTKDDDTATSSEDAENIRQKRLKQMEEEFYKFVSAAEISKDLNLPKELSVKIHKYWALKRKAQDDVPLLPPTLQQQEKLSGKQGAVNSSSNLQVQLERIVKLRCNLEKLRNLCYMVTKREKMRRELYRAREEVFWQEHAVMTDETCDMDEEAVQWVLTMCKDNFSGDGSFPASGEGGGGGCGSVAGSLSSRVSSTVESSSTTSSSGDCSSTEQNSGGGGGGDSDTKRSRGGATDEEETRDSNTEEEPLITSSPAMRTRRNSYLVSQVSWSSHSSDSVAGSSKELESIANSDSDTASKKRTRTKTQSFCEATVTTPKRVLRNTITELEETTVAQNSLEHSSSETPRRRRTRHLSLPNVAKEMKEDRDREEVGTSEEVDDAAWRETRTRLSRVSKKSDTASTGSEDNSSVKPEVDEKESRKENDPLRPQNMVELKRAGNTSKAVKRKRSKSTTAMDDNTRNKQARITDFLRRKSPCQKELRSPKSSRTRGNKRNSDSEESDQVRTDVDNSKRVPTPRSFSNGRETTSDNSSCPHCKLQHDKLSKCSWRCKEGSHSAECEDNWNRRELRVRSFQSPKSRTRCSNVVSPKPHCCGSLMSKFCHATVT